MVRDGPRLHPLPDTATAVPGRRSHRHHHLDGRRHVARGARRSKPAYLHHPRRRSPGFPAPNGASGQRCWDGDTWTEHTAPAVPGW
ncbi:hypothetical protein C6V83_02620 [Gordonia iterans]|uniref:DUF2510 domain-containing protein n=1 Tax=Gordonia iterans TaxID=1004901 RepID=A0A2S0KCD2_9ACTN|nr:hypothetical protein C6V83_02620 [Gordonia iterans]